MNIQQIIDMLSDIRLGGDGRYNEELTDAIDSLEKIQDKMEKLERVAGLARKAEEILDGRFCWHEWDLINALQALDGKSET